MPFVIKALMSGGLSAQRPVSEIASLTVAGFLLNPKVRHHFGRATSATLFLTQAWNSSCLVWNEGDLNRPLVLPLLRPTLLLRARRQGLHLSFHLTSIVPCLHLHYSILFEVCQEGFLIFLKSYHHCEEIRLLIISSSWLYLLYHILTFLSRGHFKFHLRI